MLTESKRIGRSTLVVNLFILLIIAVLLLVLKGVFAWTNPTQAPPGGSGLYPPQYVTSLPGSPNDGQEVVYEADAANKVYWHLKYKSSSGKWMKIGGPPLSAVVMTLQGTSSNGYVDLATVGPSITVPLAGSYTVEFHANAASNNAPRRMYIAPKLGSAGTSDNDGAFALSTDSSPGNGDDIPLHRKLTPRTLTAGAVVKLQYKTDFRVSDEFNEYFARELFVDPVYVE